MTSTETQDSSQEEVHPNVTAEPISEEQKKQELEDLRTLLHIRDLESKVKNYEAKTAEIRDYVKKMEAEIESIRQRAARDTQRTVDSQIGNFLNSLLGIYDNFDRSLKTSETEVSPLADGLRMIYGQLTQFLQSAGLERMTPKGEVFDPHKHEAITTQPTDIKEMDQVVMHEVRAGFRYKETVLRPAQVIVGHYQSRDDNESASAN